VTSNSGCTAAVRSTKRAHRFRLVQHADLVDRLSRDVERLAARGEDAHALGLQELLGEVGACLQHVLAVVEDHEHPLALRMARQRLDHRPPGILLHAHDRGERVRDAPLVGHGAELDEPHAVRKFEEHAAPRPATTGATSRRRPRSRA
jgi:hypothetical protein